MTLNKSAYIVIGGAIVLVAIIAVWLFFFRSSAPAQTTSSASSFGTPASNTTSSGTNSSTAGANATQPIAALGQVSTQKVFEITAGPVVGAMLIQTLHPTTTLARYIDQDDGHVYDLPLDVPGALPQVVSNTTIPSGDRVVWLQQGKAAILQYIEGGVVKSVYMGFPAASTTAGTLPTKIQFLPDAIEDIAASPDGQNIVYLLTTASGVDGYIASAAAEGVGGKKLFSLPLSQVLISWPSQGTLMAQTKSAAGVPGMVFSIDAKSGSITPLLYANGLTAIADSSFAHILYETFGGSSSAGYSHNVKSGVDFALPFNLLPETCAQNSEGTLFYCASPTLASDDYIDAWHQGTASDADIIYAYNPSSNVDTTIANPGSADGGAPSDILEMSLSPSEQYLSFTTKGDRALWGVRLNQN